MSKIFENSTVMWKPSHSEFSISWTSSTTNNLSLSFFSPQTIQSIIPTATQRSVKMVNEEDGIKSPQNLENPIEKSGQVVQNNNAHGERKDSLLLFSPRFRSVAAMAGWDEEALMIATLVVEDTPDRQHFKQKKRPDNVHTFKTPPTNSRRKRRAQRRSPASMPVAVLDLEEDAPVDPPKESETKKNIPESKKEEKESSDKGIDELDSNVSASNSSAIPCMDRLREELSCAICLEICFEPSTTPCGHSFCKKCLRFAADKCGKKCPKCRQLISNGRSCIVNTVLWNTIQLLFPQEVVARKAASASNDRQVQRPQSPVILNNSNVRNRNVQELSGRPESGNGSPNRRNHHGTRRQSVRPSRTLRRRNELPSQDEDAALALRLQREEFMGGFRGSSHQEYTSSLALARANLRAMASRAIRGL